MSLDWKMAIITKILKFKSELRAQLIYNKWPSFKHVDERPNNIRMLHRVFAPIGQFIQIKFFIASKHTSTLVGHFVPRHETSWWQRVFINISFAQNGYCATQIDNWMNIFIYQIWLLGGYYSSSNSINTSCIIENLLHVECTLSCQVHRQWATLEDGHILIYALFAHSHTHTQQVIFNFFSYIHYEDLKFFVFFLFKFFQ